MSETIPCTILNSGKGPDDRFLEGMIEHHAREHNKLRAAGGDSIEHIAIWHSLKELQRYRRLFAKLEDYFKASDEHCITFGWDDEDKDWLAFTELGMGKEPMGEFHASADIAAVLEKAVGIEP